MRTKFVYLFLATLARGIVITATVLQNQTKRLEASNTKMNVMNRQFGWIMPLPSLIMPRVAYQYYHQYQPRPMAPFVTIVDEVTPFVRLINTHLHPSKHLAQLAQLKRYNADVHVHYSKKKLRKVSKNKVKKNSYSANRKYKYKISASQYRPELYNQAPVLEAYHSNDFRLNALSVPPSLRKEKHYPMRKYGKRSRIGPHVRPKPIKAFDSNHWSSTSHRVHHRSPLTSKKPHRLLDDYQNHFSSHKPIKMRKQNFTTRYTRKQLNKLNNTQNRNRSKSKQLKPSNATCSNGTQGVNTFSIETEKIIADSSTNAVQRFTTTTTRRPTTHYSNKNVNKQWYRKSVVKKASRAPLLSTRSRQYKYGLKVAPRLKVQSSERIASILASSSVETVKIKENTTTSTITATTTTTTPTTNASTTRAPLKTKQSHFCQVKAPGYYADLENDCSWYFICAPGDFQHFRCPNKTRFSQDTLVCQWADQVDCGKA